MVIRQALKQAQLELKSVDGEIAQQESDNQRLADQLSQAQADYSVAEDAKIELNAKIDEKTLLKQLV